jgi:shikimate 5-dehydrogenase
MRERNECAQETIMPSLDILSDSAKRIGAVNTVTKQPDGKLHGDNTDWLGIKNQFESRLMARGGWAPATTTARRGTVAMLCGAGGTAKAAAYCFEQMGCSHVIIMNRTCSVQHWCISLRIYIGIGRPVSLRFGIKNGWIRAKTT